MCILDTKPGGNQDVYQTLLNTTIPSFTIHITEVSVPRLRTTLRSYCRTSIITTLTILQYMMLGSQSTFINDIVLVMMWFLALLKTSLCPYVKSNTVLVVGRTIRQERDHLSQLSYHISVVQRRERQRSGRRRTNPGNGDISSPNFSHT